MIKWKNQWVNEIIKDLLTLKLLLSLAISSPLMLKLGLSLAISKSNNLLLFTILLTYCLFGLAVFVVTYYCCSQGPTTIQNKQISVISNAEIEVELRKSENVLLFIILPANCLFGLFFCRHMVLEWQPAQYNIKQTSKH